MDVNKVKILNTVGDKYINVPLGINTDLSNRYDTVDEEMNLIVDRVVGGPINYELVRYSKKPTVTNDTSMEYNFNFLLPGANNWGTSYETTFTNDEITLLSKSFLNSFFKMDFYNTTDKLSQKIFFSIILNVTSGQKEDVNGIELTTPKFLLDHLGTQEGYYIYWYEDKTLFDLNDFYFNCKFFDARTGEFRTFITVQKNTLSSFDVVPEDKFFYKLTFNYVDKYYEIFNGNIWVNSINWYEY